MAATGFSRPTEVSCRIIATAAMPGSACSAAVDRRGIEQLAPGQAQAPVGQAVDVGDVAQPLAEGAVGDGEQLAARPAPPTDSAVSIAAVPEPVTSRMSCSGEAPNTGRSLVSQPADHAGVVLVAVADVVVDQRRLHPGRGHHRSRVEQRVAGRVLLGQQALDQGQRVGAPATGASPAPWAGPARSP